jgi:hypothetical protein
MLLGPRGGETRAPLQVAAIDEIHVADTLADTV